MVSRIVMKGSLDNLSGVLFGVGCAGLAIGVYEGEITPGVFGCIALFMGIGIRIFRTVWNEKSKQKL